jgi:hypothetical protein|tara:strand:+ start:1683 stop:2453 length:771 start_codon:yes stop_codon:yes gene_type:complete
MSITNPSYSLDSSTLGKYTSSYGVMTDKAIGGNDMSINGIDGLPQSDNSCNKLCDQDSKCMGFSMDKNNKTCWFKNNVSSPGATDQYDTYYKLNMVEDYSKNVNELYSGLQNTNDTVQNDINKNQNEMIQMRTNMNTTNNDLINKATTLMEMNDLNQYVNNINRGINKNVEAKTSLNNSITVQLYITYFSIGLLIMLLLKMTLLPNMSYLKMSFIVFMIFSITISTMNMNNPIFFMMWFILIMYFLLWGLNIIGFP